MLIAIFILVFMLSAIYINNNQKSSVRFFIWNFQNIKVGKLLSISFLSGLGISSLLNITNNLQSINKNISKNNENNTEYFNQNYNEEENNSTFDIPPQRDLRDAQPTISVNYRVVKGNMEFEGTSNNNSKYQDDWSNDETEW